MKNFFILAIFAVSSLSTVAALADCSYEGKSYATGTVINGSVCTDQGWKKL